MTYRYYDELGIGTGPDGLDLLDYPDAPLLDLVDDLERDVLRVDDVDAIDEEGEQ